MAKPRNPAHRDALLAAATRVFAAEGLGASTAGIAKEAGVSTGTLFVYFSGKAVLVNELYVTLKTQMGAVATDGLPATASPREQLRHMWDAWAAWATAAPEKRRALAHLAVADEITPASHAAISAAYADIARLLTRIVDGGPMRGTPLGFVTILLSAMADATLDDLIRHPAVAGAEDDRIAIAFDALWRALAGAPTPELQETA